MIKQKTTIIAEAGVNHNGSIKNAKHLIDAAVEAKADYIKFQTFKAENLVTKKAEKAEYQKNNTITDESQFDMLKQFELDYSAHKELVAYCNKKRIKFLSTAFDFDSIDLLEELNLPLFKIPSGEITNLPYLRKIGNLGKNIVLSTGMSTLKEVQSAMDVLLLSGIQKDQLTILHCNTEYPTPIEDANLNAMVTIRDKLNVNIGYSDHTLGLEVPIAAVALGATLIEKHFTLDRTQEGPDHNASLEPYELKSMISAIRKVECAMGDGVKRPSKSELKNISNARKSIVAKSHINAGEYFTENNLTTKRPGKGISPMKWDNLIGNKSNIDYKPDDLIKK